jgi:hypothetical protein
MLSSQGGLAVLTLTLTLILPADTFSPTGGEGRDEGVSPNTAHPHVHRNGHSFIESALIGSGSLVVEDEIHAAPLTVGQAGFTPWPAENPLPPKPSRLRWPWNCPSDPLAQVRKKWRH